MKIEKIYSTGQLVLKKNRPLSSAWIGKSKPAGFINLVRPLTETKIKVKKCYPIN